MQNTILLQVLAAAMALLTAPLIVDLVVCITGNFRRPRQARGQAPRPIRLAVVVPAHDEEPTVARTVHSLFAAGCSSCHSGAPGRAGSGPWRVPVFVVAHNCCDATAANAADAGARVIPFDNRRLHGKAAALRIGFFAARAAGANAFLMVDADSVVSSNLIAATRAALEKGAAATQCRYELQLPRYASASFCARLRVLAFKGINVLRSRGRARLGFSAGVFGNGFAVTDETLQRTPFSVDSICEDLEYHIRLVAAGMRVEWIEEAAVLAPLVRARSAQAEQEARWEGGRFRVATRGAGRLLSAVLRGNWRALEMFAEAWSLPLSRAVLALALMAFLPVHWLHLFAMAGAAVVLIYVLEAVMMGSERAKNLAALTGTPLHVLRKLAITPLVLRQTRKSAEWAPTRREANVPW